MKKFNVIIEDNGVFRPYNVIPYLVRCYNDSEKKPETFEEFKEFVKSQSMYQWWSRCEYEIILSDWPGQTVSSKWDVHMQVLMNLDVIANIVMESVL